MGHDSSRCVSNQFLPSCFKKVMGHTLSEITAHSTVYLHLGEPWAVFIQLDYCLSWWYTVEWAISSESVVSTEPFPMGHLKFEWDIVAMAPSILITGIITHLWILSMTLNFSKWSLINNNFWECKSNAKILLKSELLLDVLAEFWTWSRDCYLYRV